MSKWTGVDLLLECGHHRSGNLDGSDDTGDTIWCNACQEKRRVIELNRWKW